MRAKHAFTLILILLLFGGGILLLFNDQKKGGSMTMELIKLPEPKKKGEVSLEEAIARRRSIRDFKDTAITIEALSQLLWAGQGVTDKINMFRSAPSAGALYPLEIYVVVANVFGLEQGIYKYKPTTHELLIHRIGNFRTKLMHEALWQEWMSRCPVIFVYSAVFERTTWKYGKRGVNYVFIEVGHSAQNVCLQSVALGLGATTVGAFSDEGVKKLVGMGSDEEPLYIIPIGVPLSKY